MGFIIVMQLLTIYGMWCVIRDREPLQKIKASFKSTGYEYEFRIDADKRTTNLIAENVLLKNEVEILKKQHFNLSMSVVITVVVLWIFWNFPFVRKLILKP